MVGRVETVVQEYPVNDSSSNVAGVPELGLDITVLMLQKVNGDQHPLGKKPGPCAVDERRLPIQNGQRQDEADRSDAFCQRLPIQAGPRLTPFSKIVRPMANHLSDGS